MQSKFLFVLIIIFVFAISCENRSIVCDKDFISISFPCKCDSSFIVFNSNKYREGDDEHFIPMSKRFLKIKKTKIICIDKKQVLEDLFLGTDDSISILYFCDNVFRIRRTTLKMDTIIFK